MPFPYYASTLSRGIVQDDSGPANIGPVIPVITTLSLSPATLNINDNQLHQLALAAFDQFSNSWSDTIPASYSSSNPTGISVTSYGALQGLAGSQAATITASVINSNGITITTTMSATTSASVHTKNIVTPPGPISLIPGGTQQLASSDVDQFGVPVAGVTYTYTSSLTTVATVSSPGGLITAGNPPTYMPVGVSVNSNYYGESNYAINWEFMQNGGCGTSEIAFREKYIVPDSLNTTTTLSTLAYSFTGPDADVATAKTNHINWCPYFITGNSPGGATAWMARLITSDATARTAMSNLITGIYGRYHTVEGADFYMINVVNEAIVGGAYVANSFYSNYTAPTNYSTGYIADALLKMHAAQPTAILQLNFGGQEVSTTQQTAITTLVAGLFTAGTLAGITLNIGCELHLNSVNNPVILASFVTWANNLWTTYGVSVSITEMDYIDLTGPLVYYVSNNGSDSNNGLSPSAPWQTIAHVNAQTFTPGTSILFQNGGVWREQLNIAQSGTAGNPITIGAYGTGALPRITGMALTTGWTGPTTENGYNAYWVTAGQSHNMVTEDGNQLTQVYALTSLVPGSTYFDGTKTWVVLSGNDNPSSHTMEIATRVAAIHVTSTTGYVTIDSIYADGGSCNNGAQFQGTIWFDLTNGTAASNCIVQNCVVKNSVSEGIAFTYQTTLTNCTNCQILNNVLSYCGRFGIALVKLNAVLGSENIVQGNVLTYIGLDTVFSGSDEGVHIQSNYTIIGYNTASFIANTSQPGGAFHAVAATAVSGEGLHNIFRYNIAHDLVRSSSGDGYGFSIDQYADNCQVYYNLVYNSTGNAWYVNAAQNTKIYNNTAYNCASAGGFITATYIVGARATGTIAENNIVVTNVANAYCVNIEPSADTNSMTFEYNMYFEAAGGNWWQFNATAGATVTGWEANSSVPSSILIANELNANPQFTNPSSGVFTLAALSPAIGAGVVIPGITPSSNVSLGCYQYGVNATIGAAGAPAVPQFVPAQPTTAQRQALQAAAFQLAFSYIFQLDKCLYVRFWQFDSTDSWINKNGLFPRAGCSGPQTYQNGTNSCFQNNDLCVNYTATPAYEEFLAYWPQFPMNPLDMATATNLPGPGGGTCNVTSLASNGDSTPVVVNVQTTPAVRTIFASVNPVTINGIGEFVQETLTAEDQFGNPITATFNCVSSNPNIAIVTNTGKITSVAVGMCVVTVSATTGNAAPLAINVVVPATITPGGHPNMPSGMSAVIDTGIIAGGTPNTPIGAKLVTTNGSITNTWTNFSWPNPSPLTISYLPRNPAINVSGGGGPGTQTPQIYGYGGNANYWQWAPGSGFRQVYDTTLPGGNNAVHFGTGISDIGTGTIYYSAWVRFINWSNVGASGQLIAGVKMGEPVSGTHICSASGNTQENHVWGASQASATDLFAQFIKQINACPTNAPTTQQSENYVRGDIAPYNSFYIQTPNGNLSAVNQTYVQVEWIVQQETVAQTSNDARIQYFVNGIAAYDSLMAVPGSNYPPQGGFNLLAANSNHGWNYLNFNCTYGGSHYDNGPTQTMFYDIDRIFVAVK
jgi:Glycosyl hydrolase family 10